MRKEERGLMILELQEVGLRLAPSCDAVDDPCPQTGYRGECIPEFAHLAEVKRCGCCWFVYYHQCGIVEERIEHVCDSTQCRSLSEAPTLNIDDKAGPGSADVELDDALATAERRL